MLNWGGRKEDNREGKRGSTNNMKGVQNNIETYYFIRLLKYIMYICICVYVV